MGYDSFRKGINGMLNCALDKVTITRIYDWMISQGWNYYVYDKLFFRKQYEYEKNHPTEEMLQFKDYFKDRWDEVVDCTSLLEDEISKEVYTKMIDFRYTHDCSLLPTYDLKHQYFPKDIIHLSDNEVFLDCGACRGETYRRFQKETNGCYKRAVCFETETRNADFIIKASKEDPRLVVVPMGVWSSNMVLRFESLGLDWNGRFLQEGEQATGMVTELPVCSLDEQDSCQDATYIKMDIEGSEWDALHGAEKIILNNHPKLAISIYHSPQDYIRLIKYIHELDSTYKFYVRHHSTISYDTVLYAI